MLARVKPQIDIFRSLDCHKIQHVYVFIRSEEYRVQTS